MSSWRRIRPAVVLVCLSLLATSAHAANLFPTVQDISGVSGVGVQSGSPLGLALSDAWSDAYGSLDSRDHYVSSAWLVMWCAEPPPSGATVQVGASTAVWQDDWASLPATDLERDLALEGCEEGLAADITDIAQAWLEGEVEPAGLVIAGRAPSSDWSTAFFLDGSAAPYLQVSVSDLVDEDQDGWSAPGDCDDGDASIHPAAEEICDGVDNDCDYAIDEGNDEDGDGAITAAESFDVDGDGHTVCGDNEQEPDCDDGDPDRYPGAWEDCDGVDNDCDGARDEGCDHDGADNDLDGFREADGDEDDGDPNVFPGAGSSTATEDDALDDLCTTSESETVVSASCSQGPLAVLWLGLVCAAGVMRRRR